MVPTNGCVPIALLVLGMVFGAVGLASPVTEQVMVPGPTLVVILTATPQPGSISPAQYQATIDAQQMTIAALVQQPAALITPAPGIATLDPALLPPLPDDNCIRHEVAAGDTFFGIAQQYGVFPSDLLLANDLDENYALQIGEILIIPVAGCDALNPPIPTNTPFVLAPTITLAPTAVNAQVQIVNVQFPGDVLNEQVEIANLGSVANLQGWRLTNERGDSFEFPDLRIYSGGQVSVFSRQGATTPAALYWGRETPAWTSGERVSLFNADGALQAVFRIAN